MRTLRLSLAGTAILALLGGVGGAVLAQDDGSAPPEPVVVTGTFASEEFQSSVGWTEEGGIYRWEGPWWILTWEASDPRLIGQGTKISNLSGSESTEIGIGASTYVLDGPDGRWVGSGYTYGAPTGGVDLLVLHGEGAYDGLTSVLSIDWSDVATFEGVIFPGEAPEIPEPIEPSTE